MPSPRFMRDMGVASIVAGLVMLGISAVHPGQFVRKLGRMR